MKINFGLMAVNRKAKRIEHFCGYTERPTRVDHEALMEELTTDPEFGLVDRMDEIVLLEAPPEVVKLYRDRVEPID